MNNYDAWEMVIRLNESVAKAVEEARHKELRQKIEAEAGRHIEADRPIHKAIG